MELKKALNEIPGIGQSFLKKLRKMGIQTIEDLLFHFPHRYEDFSNVVPIKAATLNQVVCFRGKILDIENTTTLRRRMILTQAILEDSTGAIKVVWFNQPYLTRVIKKGENYFLAGKVVLGEDGLYLSNPAFEKLTKTENLEPIHTARLVPVYPETEGLSSKWLRSILYPLLKKLANKIKDPLPEEIIKKYQLLPINKALWQIHFPKNLDLAQKAQKRFSFEELFYIQILVLQERIKINRQKAVSIPLNLELIKSFVNSLPFELTNAQKKAIWHILNDLQKTRPMNRLLEGDVGSGKTVVATAAILMTIKAGYQAALMVPTEVLSKQHFQEIGKLLKKFKISIGLLTSKENKMISNGKVEKLSRKKILEKIKNAEIDLIIGTHALIQDSVQFKNLALVIVDEQHRFGVEQRAKLAKGKNVIPHLLSMTATPIPRTLTLTLYGDLDLSLLDEMPKGRKKIITKIIAPAKREKVYQFIRREIEKGRQAFIICPRIEAPEETGIEEFLSLDTKSVKEEFRYLSEKVFPDLKLGMLHGRMKSKEKEEVMTKFKNKEFDILVSTSAVEVGIDVPNATVIVIEGAERFGLAQLHQFRGRVGRSEFQSYCFLFTDSPAKKTRQRLQALITSSDGFKLAEKDLEIRGPGSLFGIKQWGVPDLAMKSLKDIKLVEETRLAARQILERDPGLKSYPLLKKKIEEVGREIHLE
jgi:ATP-dependent DNA helicase RecG